MADSKDGFEQLDVRAKWKDEARDFTPWLAENIEVLGDALGMKLKTCQTELPIGRFFLDILAREIDEDVAIAIENQLEETDLHHLGQLTHVRDRLRRSHRHMGGAGVWLRACPGIAPAQRMDERNNRSSA